MSADAKSDFVTCRCQFCGGGIEFDASVLAPGEVRTTECPHCRMMTTITAARSKPTAQAASVPPVLPAAKANAMTGTILDYTVQANAGLISGDNNRRYSFQGAEWRETGKFPVKGMRVDFAPKDDAATAIYLIQDAPNSTSESAGKRDCNHVVAGLLGIFLGWIGVHKFYMGYKNEGIILLICGTVGWLIFVPLLFSAVAGLVEGIIYLSQTQQQFETTYITGKRKWF